MAANDDFRPEQAAVRPAPPTMKPQAVADLVRAANVSTVVETGTYFGRTTEALAGLGIQVHTLEISDRLHEMVATKFKGRSNVTCHKGDSAHLLYRVAKEIHGPALFFFDAQSSSGSTRMGKDACPIKEELGAVFDHFDGDQNFILIDYARLLTGLGCFPSLTDVAGFIRYYWPQSTQAIISGMLFISPRSFDALPAWAAPEPI